MSSSFCTSRSVTSCCSNPLDSATTHRYELTIAIHIPFTSQFSLLVQAYSSLHVHYRSEKWNDRLPLQLNLATSGEICEQQKQKQVEHQLVVAQVLRDALARHAVRRRVPVQCNYCRKMQQPPSCYLTHRTRDGNGLVVCPLLRLVRCALCGASGDFAHTTTYCPYNPSGACASRRAASGTSTLVSPSPLSGRR